MSEEAAVFARQDEPSEPFAADVGTAHGDVAETRYAACDFDGQVDSGNSFESAPTAAPQVAEVADGDDIPDPLTSAVLAPDSQQFLLGIVAILAQDMRRSADVTGLAIMLSELGWALSDGLDETQVFEGLVEALDRRRVGKAALRTTVPIVAAFVARIAARPRLEAGSSAHPSEVEGLIHAAEDLVGAALEAGGPRAWRRLPEIASSAARRVAQRDLPVAVLAETLPRLAARFGVGQRDAVVSDRDHPRGSLSRGGAAGEPRQMVISGPLEIVILGR